MTPALLGFLASGAVIVAAGTALAKSGDAIAEHTRLGRVWIGSVLLAGATSLPELTTDVAAVRLGVPDLAAGDLFGSSLANMLLLALLGLLPPAGRIFREASFDHAMAASLAIILNGLGALFVLTHTEWTLLGAGPESALLLIVFVSGRERFTCTRSFTLSVSPAPRRRKPPLITNRARRPLCAARWRCLPWPRPAFYRRPYFAASAKQIAEMSGLGTTFVGTLLWDYPPRCLSSSPPSRRCGWEPLTWL